MDLSKLLLEDARCRMHQVDDTIPLPPHHHPNTTILFKFGPLILFPIPFLAHNNLYSWNITK